MFQDFETVTCFFPDSSDRLDIKTPLKRTQYEMGKFWVRWARWVIIRGRVGWRQSFLFATQLINLSSLEIYIKLWQVVRKV